MSSSLLYSTILIVSLNTAHAACHGDAGPSLEAGFMAFLTVPVLLSRSIRYKQLAIQICLKKKTSHTDLSQKKKKELAIQI